MTWIELMRIPLMQRTDASSDTCSRRDFLRTGGAGFPALALTYLLAEERARAQAPAVVDPLAARPGHVSARAKSCIFLFMEGGPSAMDLFDPKPLLTRLAGQRLPSSFRPVITSMGET